MEEIMSENIVVDGTIAQDEKQVPLECLVINTITNNVNINKPRLLCYGS